MSKLLSTTEVGARLNCHPQTVMRKARTDPNFPKPMRLARRYYFPEEAVDAYEGREREAAA